MNLRDALLRGIDHEEIFYSPFLGEKVRLRPLTKWELDDCIIEGLKSLEDDVLANMLMRFYVFQLNDRVGVEKEDLEKLFAFRRNVDIQICLRAIKGEELDEEVLRNSSLEISEIATIVRKMSVASKSTLRGLMSTEDGKLLATLVLDFNTPITSDAWKATRLQIQFIDGERIERSTNKNTIVFNDDELNESPDARRRVLDEFARYAR